MGRKTPSGPAKSQEPEALDTAWRIHDAQSDWTGKVDAKAAFALTIHSALLVVVVTLFNHLGSPLEYVLYGACVTSLLTGAGLAANVVSPRLRSRGLRQGANTNAIYFGHARFLDPDDLTHRLRTQDPLPQISRQIVTMAQIAWTKHVRVAWSIWLGVLGGALLLVVALMTQTG
ncbi:Pycsar system effector family protein [Cellulosimicrobium sp. KWT-B]|uniref:Pycsar system effector family protein n=1 Tax=Cellulosimicrobium sp. KWT-B TaxID=1981152 RepID=UPI000A329D38|nr:Pycsar system effector family protein [Cellulosimicrobium sp. KWT-B]